MFYKQFLNKGLVIYNASQDKQEIAHFKQQRHVTICEMELQ